MDIITDVPQTKLVEESEIEALKGSATRPFYVWLKSVFLICFSIQQSGPSSQRPTTSLWIGRRYFDTDLNSPVYLASVNPTTWIAPGGTGVASIPLIAGDNITIVDAPGKRIISSTSSQPGSPDRSVQFNKGGGFGGNSELVWDDSGKILNLTGSLNFPTSGSKILGNNITLASPNSTTQVHITPGTGTTNASLYIDGASNQAATPRIELTASSLANTVAIDAQRSGAGGAPTFYIRCNTIEMLRLNADKSFTIARNLYLPKNSISATTSLTDVSSVYYDCSAASGNIVVTILSGTITNNGSSNAYTIYKKTDSSSNTVTIQSGFGTIEGAANYVLTTQNQYVILLGDGSADHKIIGSGPSGGSGSGTVTSVALSLPGIFSVIGSPVTTSGTLSAALVTQAANTIFAGPSSGSAAIPSFRALTLTDLPSGLAFSGPITASGLTMSTNMLLGRSTTGTGAVEQISLGSGLSLSAGVLTATGSTSPVFGPSGVSHSVGLVPDPGSTAGATRFLREDATWATPAGGAGSITTSGYTMNTARLLGRTTAASGAVEEISIGSNLTLTGGVLSASGGGTGSPGGSTTQVQYNNAGAFAGASNVTIATTGDLNFTASSRVLGAWNGVNVAVSSTNTFFQNPSTNYSTVVGAMPNGSGTTSGYFCLNSTNTTSGSFAFYYCNATAGTIETNTINGSGTQLPIQIKPGGAVSAMAYPNGNWNLGTSTVDKGFKLSIEGTSPRIAGNWNGVNTGVTSNNLMFQNFNTNFSTVVGALPNGTGTTSGYFFMNSTNFSSASFGFFYCDASAVHFDSNTLNGSSALPMIFSHNNLTHATAFTNGNWNFGTTTTDPGVKARVEGAFTSGTANQFQVNATGNIIKLNNVTTSFPSANSVGTLSNDGAGNLTWVNAPGVRTAIKTVSATYSVTTADATILADSTAASFTITLPTPASAYNATTGGQLFIFTKIAAANNVTISGTILSGSTIVMSSIGSVLRFQSNGTTFYPV